MIIIIIFFILLLNFLFIQNLNAVGNYYYKKPIQLYDIGFKYLPNLHKYAFIADIIIILSFLSFFIPGLFIQFIYLIIPIWFIRFVTASVTVLPKTNECNIRSKLYSTFFGGCYDKIFSGHFAVVFSITLLLLEKSYISMMTTAIINIVNGLFIIAVRNHYTIDVIVSFFVTLCIYQFVNTHKTWIETVFQL